MGPEPREAGDGLAEGNVLYALLGSFPDLGQPCGGGVGALKILRILGGGTDEQIAVDRGRHQHALAQHPGQLENGGVHRFSRGLIQQQILAPPGGNVDFVFAHHIVQHPGIHPRGIDHRPGNQGLPFRNHQPGALFPGANLGNPGSQPELHAVLDGVLSQGHRHPEGTDDAPRRCPEGCHRGPADVGLHFVKPPGIDDLQALHSVLKAVFIKCLQSGQIRPVHAQHQRAVAPEGNVQLPGKLRHHPAAQNIVFCHQGARLGIKACMDDGAVGF